MNRSRWLLLSFALNALLLLAVVRQYRPLLVPSGGSDANRSVVPAENQAVNADSAASVEPAVDVTSSAATFHWSQFNVADWPAYRDGLRSIGCPERTRREILEPLVRRHYVEQVHTLAAPYVSRFWDLMRGGGKQGFEGLKTAVEELSEKQKESLKQLLGDPGPADERSTTGNHDERLAFLPAAVRERVVAAQARQRERWQEYFQNFQSDNNDSRKAASKALQEEANQELASLLSPEELAEYRRRNSRFANLRELEGVELSEPELAVITRLKEREQSGNSPMTNEVAVLLGPERFADFERAQQPGYQELLRLSERLEAKPETARELWDARQSAERTARVMAKDTQLSSAERAAQLAALREAMRAHAGEVLGARGLAAWERQQADWLKQSFDLPEEDPLAGSP